MPPNDELVRNQLRCLVSIDEGVGKIYDALRETAFDYAFMLWQMGVKE